MIKDIRLLNYLFRFCVIFFLVVLCSELNAQNVINNGSYIVVEPGAYVVISDIYFNCSDGIDDGKPDLDGYDRWGEEIFHSCDAEIGWNGSVDNEKKQCQDGVYIWLLMMEDKYGEVFKEKGTVTLLGRKKQ